MEKKATFGAGCFWGVEAAFRQIDGVTATRSATRAGAREPDLRGRLLAHDRARRGRRGDLRRRAISYDELLAIFWGKHDPTQLNRQGWDVGDQYRSVVFFHDEEQRAAAEQSKAEPSSRSLQARRSSP